MAPEDRNMEVMSGTIIVICCREAGVAEYTKNKMRCAE